MDKLKNASQKKSESRFVGREFRLAMRIVTDFGASIAVPAFFSAFVGVRLDERFGTRPWLLICCLTIAFIITAVWINRKAKQYAVLYNKI